VGIAGYETVVKLVPIANNSGATGTVECPTGKRVLSGGTNLAGGSSLTLGDAHSFDFTSGGVQHSGWLADVHNGQNGDTTFSVYAICANVS
jgi:hypothetical protein